MSGRSGSGRLHLQPAIAEDEPLEREPEQPSETSHDGGATTATGRAPDPWLRFASIFALLVLCSEASYYAFMLGSEALDVYLSALARISGEILRWLGEDVSVHQARIGGRGFAVQISPECDAPQLCGILSAAIIAFRAPLHRKLIGIALGVAWLQIVNFARIVSLFFVGASKAVPFDTAHEVVWPAVLIAITIATWIVWARRIPIEEAPA